MTHRVRNTTPQPSTQHELGQGAIRTRRHSPLASKGLDAPHLKPHVDQGQLCWHHWRQRRKQAMTRPFCIISAEMQHQAQFYRVRTGLGGLRKEQRNMEQKRPFRSLSPLGKGSCWDCVISTSTQEFLWQTNYCLGTGSWHGSGQPGTAQAVNKDWLQELLLISLAFRKWKQPIAAKTQHRTKATNPDWYS